MLNEMIEPPVTIYSELSDLPRGKAYSNGSLSSEHTVYEVFYYEVVQNLFKAPHFVIYLLNPDNQNLECQFAVIAGKHIPVDQISPFSRGFFTTRILNSGHPAIVNLTDAILDTEIWKRYLNGLPLEATDIKSILCTPVLDGEKPIGLLCLAHDQINAFNQQFTPFLSMFANMIARGHQNQQLVHDLKEKSVELQSLYNASSTLFKSRNMLELSAQITQAVVREFNHVDCGLILKNRDQDKLVRIARSGKLVQNPTSELYVHGPGLVPEAIRSGKIVYAPRVKDSPLYVENEPLTQSELVIPLTGMDAVVGAFDLQSTEADGFSQRDQRVLMAFAERAAGAIEIVQLYESLDQYAAELEFRVAQRMSEVISSKEKVEAILNSTSDAIIVLNEQGLIQQANPAFSRALGYDDDRLFANSIENMVEIGETRLQDIIQSVIQNQTTERRELKAISANGNTFEVDAVFSPLSREDSSRPLLICSLRDITAQKRLQAGLKEALEHEKELSEMKSRFSSTVSHEFRTPLAVIQSSVDILDSNSEQAPPALVRRHLNKIADQVRRLTDLVSDVLVVSRSDAIGMAFKPVQVNLDEFCQSVVDDVRQHMRSDGRLMYAFEGSCVEAQVDVDLIRHIMINLMTNALKYSPTSSHVCVNLTCHVKQAVLTVKDEGIGIPDDAGEQIFDDFYRAQNVGTIHGTGLGLSIVKRAVEAHRGSVRFESSKGQGTTFIVTFPTDMSA